MVLLLSRSIVIIFSFKLQYSCRCCPAPHTEPHLQAPEVKQDNHVHCDSLPTSTTHNQAPGRCPLSWQGVLSVRLPYDVPFVVFPEAALSRCTARIPTMLISCTTASKLQYTRGLAIVLLFLGDDTGVHKRMLPLTVLILRVWCEQA